MKSVRYAVVGLNHGKGHVETILNNRRAELSAVCDLSGTLIAETMEQVKDRHPERSAPVQSFNDYRQLLDWGQFDAVVLATPPHVHADMAIAALKAKKHVLLEKPLTNTIPDAGRLMGVVKKSKTVFQVGYCVRSSALIRKIRQIIRAGKIGDVVLVWWHMFLQDHVRESWRTSRKTGGGKLIDCCCHYMDILQVLAGAPFYRISAFGNEKGDKGPNADDIPRVATVNVEYDNGVKGSLCLSEITPAPENSLFGVAGTRGIIYGNPWRPDGAGSLDCYIENGLYREQININGAMASRGHLGFAEQHEAFLDAVLKGSAVPCTVEDGYEVVLTMTAVDRSIATGKAISRKELAGGKK